MEEEKKKRVRATLTQVRALESELARVREDCRLASVENGHLRDDLAAVRHDADVLRRKLDEQVDGTSRLVADCDLWRAKYRALVDKYDTAERSNGYMHDELVRVREARDEARERCAELANELHRIKNRGFVSRVFNRNI